MLTFLTNQNGTNIYTLTMQAKQGTESSNLFSPDQIPIIGIDKWSASSTFLFTRLNTIQQWESYTFTDTITTLPADTIAVYIYSYASQMSVSDFLFDKIELTKTSL